MLFLGGGVSLYKFVQYCHSIINPVSMGFSWTKPNEICPNLFQVSQDSLTDNLVHLEPKDCQGIMDPVVSSYTQH